MDLANINYFAVLLAVVASMIIGSIWYAPPLFGKLWMSLLGKSKEEMGSPMFGMSAAIVSAAVMAICMALIFKFAGVTTLRGGLKVGFLLWLGLVVTTYTLNFAFQGKKSWKLWAIDLGNHFFSVMSIAVVLSLVR